MIEDMSCLSVYMSNCLECLIYCDEHPGTSKSFSMKDQIVPQMLNVLVMRHENALTLHTIAEVSMRQKEEECCALCLASMAANLAYC